MWLTTTNQQEIDTLKVVITDLGACQRLADLGPTARDFAMEDLYQLGFVFLELVLASYSEDNIGAQTVRARLGKITLSNNEYYVLVHLFLYYKLIR
jgi:hypothetical protein